MPSLYAHTDLACLFAIACKIPPVRACVAGNIGQRLVCSALAFSLLLFIVAFGLLCFWFHHIKQPNSPSQPPSQSQYTPPPSFFISILPFPTVRRFCFCFLLAARCLWCLCFPCCYLSPPPPIFNPPRLCLCLYVRCPNLPVCSLML